MRPVFENGAPVPAFLNKLWKMVDDEKTDNLISWSPGGQSFIIKHQGDFCTKLLPQFYKHSNMASFVRQLNMYGFHKVSNIENGVHRGEREEIEFIHLYFKKGEPKLVERIKRKMSSRLTNSADESKNMEMMTKVLKDVAQMRGRQLSLDTQLATMKQHNVALWRELSLLRRKHHKQQQIVNKLIQFLVSLVQPSRNNLNGLGVKRRYPLMINDITQSAKPSKISRNESSGPTIHELDNTEALLEEAEMLEDCIEPLVEIHSPESSEPTPPESNKYSSESSSKNPSPILLEFDDSLPSDDCPLSPDLLFATSPHLVTPAPETPSPVNTFSNKEVSYLKPQSSPQPQPQPQTQPPKQTRVGRKPKAANINKIIIENNSFLNKKSTGTKNNTTNNKNNTSIVKNNTPIIKNNTQSHKNNTMVTIEDLSDVIVTEDSSNQSQESIPTILVSSVDADMLKAAADEFGFLVSNDEEIVSDENPILGSANDLTKLLETSVKSEPVERTYTPPELIIPENVINNQQLSPGNEYIDIRDIKFSSNSNGSDSLQTPVVTMSTTEPFTTAPSNGMSLAPVSSDNTINRITSANGSGCSQNLDTHLESMQSELDSLKELLVGEGYIIDANTLLGLFGDDPMSYTLPMPENETSDTTSSNSSSSTNGTNNNNTNNNTTTTTNNVNSADPVLSGSELMCAPAFDIDMFASPENGVTTTTPEDSQDALDITDNSNILYLNNTSVMTPNSFL